MAGIVTGAFAVAEATVGPQSARLIDRYGQLRVLPWLLGVHTTAIVGLLLGAAAHVPSWLIVLAAAVAGAAIPQLGALTATRWNRLLRDSPLLPSALSLESLSNDVAYVVGPALVATVAATVHPVAGSALAAAFVLTGGLALVTQRRTAPAVDVEPAEGSAAGDQGLRSRGFVVLLAVTAAIGVYFGTMQVAIAGFAIEHSATSAAGLLYGISSIASLLSGLVYGSRNWHASPAKQLGIILWPAGCIRCTDAARDKRRAARGRVGATRSAHLAQHDRLGDPSAAADAEIGADTGARLAELRVGGRYRGGHGAGGLPGRRLRRAVGIRPRRCGTDRGRRLRQRRPKISWQSAIFSCSPLIRAAGSPSIRGSVGRLDPACPHRRGPGPRTRPGCPAGPGASCQRRARGHARDGDLIDGEEPACHRFGPPVPTDHPLRDTFGRILRRSKPQGRVMAVKRLSR